MPTLKIQDLRAEVEGKEILKGLSLTVKGGEVHAIMGPNGSGKSTLAQSLMGHPLYQITGGVAELDGTNLLELEPDERARLGLFLAFQYPNSIPGITVANFLRMAVAAKNGETEKAGKPEGASVLKFHKELTAKMKEIGLDPAFAGRYVNDGFSGGEKKRMEVLQMTMLRPKVAILDETDSGLDIDAVRAVAEGVNRLKGPDMGVLLITHYKRILNYIPPDHVHVLYNGRIVESGGPELADQLEEKGYDWVREEQGGAVHA